MLEVEVKFPNPDRADLIARLTAWGAIADPPREDTDHYFNAPDRDLARTDEVFRIRRIGTANFLTYKGPKRDASTKSRTEVELPIASGSDAAATAVKLFAFLGYRPVAVVTKSRQVYRINRGGFDIEVCLDDVGAVGRYVELEIKTDEAHFTQARDVIMKTASELGLSYQERRSYLELLLTLGPAMREMQSRG